MAFRSRVSPRGFVVIGMTLASVLSCAERRPAPNGETQSAARIQLDTNRAVEVIGLRWWTVDMLQDSLAKYAPGEGLDSSTVAANLRYKLHFADAALHTSDQVFDENETTDFTIVLREPRDSTRVHFIPQHLDTMPRDVAWKAITSKLAGTDNQHLLDVVAGVHLKGPSRTSVDSSDKNHPVTSQLGYAFESSEDSVAAQPIVDAIEKRVTDRDLTSAIRTLDQSSSLPDRIAAVLVLANFPKRDSAWHTLLRAVVGAQQGRDAALAAQALEGLSERFPRTVDWTPAATTVHDILDGTAVMALPGVATALANTGASPRDASAFLARGGDLLVAQIESADVDLSEPAHRLLVALRGSDLGADTAPWRAWIRTL